MQVQLKFKNINRGPECKILLNGDILYQGQVLPLIDINFQTNDIQIILTVEFTNKNPEDTIVSNGTIIQDKNFELDQIIFDKYNIEELIWQSNYFACDGQIFPSCLFFGPPGYFEIKFHQPILHWILSTRNNLHNNDPEWEIDYNYYTEACKLLQQISQK